MTTEERLMRAEEKKEALADAKAAAPKYIVVVSEYADYHDISWFFYANDSKSLVKLLKQHRMPNRTMTAFEMTLKPVRFIPEIKV